MRAVRHLLAKRQVSALICTMALLLKVLVPAGYMVDSTHGRIAITICTGTGPVKVLIDSPRAARGTADEGNSADPGKAELPCAFAGFSAAMTGPIDPAQLIALIAFIMAIALAGIRLPAPRETAYLRPPLRGPPLRL